MTPMITMPSVDPTSETSPASGVGLAIWSGSEATLRLCVDAAGCLKFVEASTKTSVMNTSVIPKI